jgi:hypothetical protein
LYDDSYGAYRDNDTAAGALVHPQDANSLALLFNITESTQQGVSISKALKKAWNAYGAVNPESG